MESNTAVEIKGGRFWGHEGVVLTPASDNGGLAIVRIWYTFDSRRMHRDIFLPEEQLTVIS